MCPPSTELNKKTRKLSHWIVSHLRQRERQQEPNKQSVHSADNKQANQTINQTIKLSTNQPNSHLKRRRPHQAATPWGLAACGLRQKPQRHVCHYVATVYNQMMKINVVQNWERLCLCLPQEKAIHQVPNQQTSACTVQYRSNVPAGDSLNLLDR